MFVGALFVGIHMATTHGVTLAMMSSYIPTTQVAGIGKISGTAWSLTDFIFGEGPRLHAKCRTSSHTDCLQILS